MKYFLAFIACAAAISVYSAYAQPIVPVPTADVIIALQNIIAKLQTLVDSLTDTTFTTIYEILNELKNLLVSAPAGQIAGIISSLSTQILSLLTGALLQNPLGILGGNLLDLSVLTSLLNGVIAQLTAILAQLTTGLPVTVPPVTLPISLSTLPVPIPLPL
ncbi:hypothetical protein WR25_08934 [Diploscapter pachys]|uniref:SXP/RAL-2 family protein Ani s 5-like cation-binding domain-containing protein n=1 Tax=Diploscapter pachys TaxID=2018661 RepID=A0A2A2LSD4_9BILA|nr:hypothetical protein WR25_08934 [Diploscapter pachys]